MWFLGSNGNSPFRRGGTPGKLRSDGNILSVSWGFRGGSLVENESTSGGGENCIDAAAPWPGAINRTENCWFPCQALPNRRVSGGCSQDVPFGRRAYQRFKVVGSGCQKAGVGRRRRAVLLEAIVIERIAVGKACWRI